MASSAGRRLLTLLVVGCYAQSAYTKHRALSQNNEVPLCAEYNFEMGGGAVPDYARAQSDLKLKRLLKREKRTLRLDLKALVQEIAERPSELLMCFKNDTVSYAEPIRDAWMDFFVAQKVRVKIQNFMPWRENERRGVPCTTNFVWAMKGKRFLYFRKSYTSFPHVFIQEMPWFWRRDPVKKGRRWYFFGWDYLGGYAVRFGPTPPNRWNKYFAGRIAIQPWLLPNSGAYALLLGQSPSDLGLINARNRFGSIDNAYKYIVDSIKSRLPHFDIYYLAHPKAVEHEGMECRLSELEGVNVWTYAQKSLSQALSGAAFVVTISAISAIEAIFEGIPVINLDPAGPAWPVSCHDFSNLPELYYNGTSCRPPREQYLAEIAHMIWNVDEVRNGDAFRYYFNTNLETRPVEGSWRDSEYHYTDPENSTNLSNSVPIQGDFESFYLEDDLGDDATLVGRNRSEKKEGRINSFMEALKQRQ